MLPPQIAAMRKNYERNPVAWSADILNRRLWKRQQEILNKLQTHTRVLVKSCHAAGKSYLASVAALHFLLHNPGCIVITTAPTLRQVEAILWKEIRAAVGAAAFPLWPTAPLKRQWELKEGWFAMGFTATETDRFQGLHAPRKLVIGDEAGGLTQEVFTGIEAIASSGVTTRLLIGNPTDAMSQFAREFGGPSDRIARFTISAFDTPNFTAFGITIEDIRSGAWEAKIAGREMPVPALISPTWVRERWESWCGGRAEGETASLWRSRVIAEFPAGERDAIVPAGWYAQAVIRAEALLEEGRETKERRRPQLGLDVSANEGNGDWTVLSSFDGDVARVLDAWRMRNTMDTVGRAAKWYRDLGAVDIAVDAIGLGAGVADRLGEMSGFNVIRVNVARAAHDSIQYKSVGTEIWWHVRKRLDPMSVNAIGVVDLEHVEGAKPSDMLEAQLCNRKWKEHESSGKIIMESKDEMAERGLPSPDRADSIALAIAPREIFEDTREDIGFVIAGPSRSAAPAEEAPRPDEATRIVIVGGPRTGKSTLAARFSHIAKRNSTDETIGMDWSQSSHEVSKWFEQTGPWLIEGVATARALRKWLQRHNMDKPCDRIVVLTSPRVAQTTGQATMSKGIETVWKQIEQELRLRGCEILYDPTDEALGLTK